MASKKLKITVEQKPFQRDWPEKGKKQILNELQSDFQLKMDNYITKRAELSLQIRIVKLTPFMISTKGQAILVTQKQSQLILGEPQHNISSSQFQIYGFRNPYNRLDRNDKGGGILLFVRENLRKRLSLRHSFPHDIKILIELNLRKKKWLIC